MVIEAHERWELASVGIPRIVPLVVARLARLRPNYPRSGSAPHQITRGDSRPIVAIIDSGLKLDHPDMLLNVWINEGELPAGMRANGQAGAGADFDNDGVITFRDLNKPGHDSFFASFGITKSAGNPNFVDAYDILAALTNGQDEDNNLFFDDLVGWNFLNNSNDPTPATQNNVGPGGRLNLDLHGQAIAGIVAATIDNSYGTAGVAPFARVIPLKVGGAEIPTVDSSKSDAALSYAAMVKADVVNFSLGHISFRSDIDAAFGVTDPNVQSPQGVNETQCVNGLGGEYVPPSEYASRKAQRDKLWQHFANSFLVALAAGNCQAFLSSDTRSKYFADGVGVPGVSNIVTVTGLQSGTQVVRPASETVAGVMGSDVVDIGAPASPEVIGDPTFHNGQTGATGTSFSAPFVAGAAALILSQEPSLRGHWSDLRARILNNADSNIVADIDLQAPGEYLVKSGEELIKDGRRLNVCSALANAPCPVAPVSPDGGATCVPQTCSVGQVFNPATCLCELPGPPVDAGAGCDAPAECPEGESFNFSLCECTIIVG
jgi:subtilisin family serine protease